MICGHKRKLYLFGNDACTKPELHIIMSVFGLHSSGVDTLFAQLFLIEYETNQRETKINFKSVS